MGRALSGLAYERPLNMLSIPIRELVKAGLGEQYLDRQLLEASQMPPTIQDGTAQA